MWQFFSEVADRRVMEEDKYDMKGRRNPEY